MKNDMLTSVAVIESHTAALRAEILMLPDEVGVTPEPVPEPVPTPPAPLVIVPTTKEMLIRSVALTQEQQALLAKLKRCGQLAPNGARESGNLDGLFRSGRLNDIGRNGAIGIVPVMAALRFIGDKALADVVLRALNNLKATVKRPAGWFNEGPTTTLQTEMELLLSYALVAQMTFCLKQNAHIDTRYAEAAKFWEMHLLQDFVPRHGSYLGTLRKPLFHPWCARIRLVHYLWKLTGDVRWRDERDSEVAMLHKELLKVEGRYCWSHYVNHLRSSPVFPLQHVGYSGESLLSLADLGFENVLDKATMERFANTVAWMSDGGSPNFMKGANGSAGTYYSELLGRNVEAQPMEYGRAGNWVMQMRGYGLLSAYDETGEITGLCAGSDNGAWTNPIVGQLIGR